MRQLLFIMLVALPYMAFCQQLSITGNIDYNYKFGKDYLPIKLLIRNKTFSDSTIMDSSFHFSFKNLEPGTYQLKVFGLSGQTGFADILITNIKVFSHLILPAIVLQKVKICEGPPVILGKKEEKEYYKNGRLKVEGKYLHVFKRSDNGKYPYYKKTGEWLYYNEDGTIQRKSLYIDDDLRQFVTYYSNGKAKLSGGYYYGCRHGNWKLFSPDGSLRFIVNFDDIYLTRIDFRYLGSFMENYKVVDE